MWDVVFEGVFCLELNIEETAWGLNIVFIFYFLKIRPILSVEEERVGRKVSCVSEGG